MTQNSADFTFAGLVGGRNTDEGNPSLCYLVGLVDSPSHEISNVLTAERILSWLYDAEEQSANAEELKSGESFFNRYFDGGYHPQTPCMLVKVWSPISAVLDRGFEPEMLNKDQSRPHRSAVSGIWKPQIITGAVELEKASTVEDLFWSVMAKVSRRAVSQKMWISIIAKPGWHYDSAIGSLPTWRPEEMAKAGRVLWKRTPEG